MTLIPTHAPATLDANYNRVRREYTAAERVEIGRLNATAWDRKAAEFETSADRWSSTGQATQAANNLATAKSYREIAAQWRAEADALASTGDQAAA